MRRSFLLMAAAPALFVGCMPDVATDPEPTPRVSAVFDPDTATIPLPNTAALDEDGTLPALPGTGEDTANGAFLSWLDGLHGWSEATPIAIPFSGPLDESTVTPDNVKMFRWTADGTAEEVAVAATLHVPNDEAGSVCEPSVCGAMVIAVPAETPEFGTSYSVVVTKDVKGADGKEVAESSAVFFAASETPLVADGEATVSVLEDDLETANTLEGLRQLLAPTFEAAATAGIPRDRVASAQSWTVVADPLTVLDPATSTLPIPNTLAIESDGTFPAAALNFCGGPGVDSEALANTACDAPPVVWNTCEASADCEQYREDGDPAAQCVSGRCVFTRCAQGQFDKYLDGLHGWPTTTPITLPVNAALDAETLNDTNVQLWAVIDGVPTKVAGTTVAVSECGGEVTITLPEDAPEMGYATSYIAFATKDVKGENGFPLTPPAAVLLAMMPQDPGELVGDCTAEEVGAACDGGGVCAAITGEGYKCVASLVPNVSDDDAASVMAIRPLFQPTVAAIGAAAGVEWNQLAAVWTWETWTDTFMLFDPLTGDIPFPHTILETGCPDEENICLLPDGEGATAPIMEALKRRSGFSSTAPHWIPTLGPPLDETTVNTDTVLFAEADVIPPPIFPADEWSVSYEWDRIIARFDRPLKADTLVAGLTTTDLMGSNGYPAQPTPAFVFLRSEFPLVDSDGVRTINEIPDDATAQALEASRSEFEQLFLVALLFGYGRDQVNNAWAFTTGYTTRPLQRLRARTINEMAGGAPIATANSPDVVANPTTVPAPDMITTDIDVSNLSAIHWNVEFDTYMWQDENDVRIDTPTRAPVGVSIFIPAPAGGCNAPYDVVIAQHGHGGWRKNMGLAVANEMASNCIATIAMDLPKHGGRITGSPELHPTSNPPTSGDDYITEDFIGTLNTFQQAVLDQVVMVRMLKEGAFDNAVGGAFTDSTSQIGYMSMSMGSFAGTLLSTIEPDVGPAVLNVVGGNYATLLTDSESYGPLFDAIGIPEGSFEELQALHMIQWLGEHADPYTFAPYPVLNPLTEVLYDGTDFSNGTQLPAKDIMIQMVTDDPTVPNSATVPLARVMGVELTDTTYPAGTPHGFLGHIDPAAADAAEHNCAVQQGAAWISSAFAGTPATTTVSSCGL